jgi:glycine cleavage system H protein
VEASIQIRDDLKYTKEHEWVKLEGETATVGITDYAQRQLGDVVFVELPQVGIQVEQMKAFGVIEAVKAVSDLFSPITGEVTKTNSRRRGLDHQGEGERPKGDRRAALT